MGTLSKLIIRHRNHLSIMSANPVTVGVSTVVNFTDGSIATYGTDAQKDDMGIHRMWAGDANANGVIVYSGSGNDRSLILIEIGGSNIVNIVNNFYGGVDINMDGNVMYSGSGNDRSIILVNIGGSNIVASRLAQMP